MHPESPRSALAQSAIRSSLLLHVAVPLVLIALVIGVQIRGLRQSHEQYLEHARLSAQNLGATLAASIAGSFQSIDITLLAAIGHVHLQQLSHGLNETTFNATLQDLKSRVPSLISLRVTNATGDVVYGTGPVANGKINVVDRAYFQKLKANPHAGMMISEPIFGRIIQKWVLVCARRFNLPNGEFGGIVYGAIELEGMAERLSGKEIKLGDLDVFALRDDDLNLITRYVHSTQDMQIMGRKLISPKLDELARSGLNAGIYESNSVIDKVARIFYFQRIAGQPLNLIVGLSRDDALSGWRREANSAGIATVIFAFLVSLASGLLYRAQMRKLQAVDNLEAALNFNQKIIDNSAVGIHVYRQNGQCILANPAIARIIGGTHDVLLQQNFRELKSWKQCGALELAELALASGTTQHLQAQVITSFGKAVWLQWTFTSFSNHGEQQLLVMMRDITEIELAREALEDSNRKLEALSTTDALTGIANRRRFDESLKKEWRRAARNRQTLALAMIDVDHFKDYNDHYGHQGGDDCLRKVAQVLDAHVRRAGDLVARYGGEEFAFIAPSIDSANALHLAQLIRQALEQMALPHALSPFGCITVSIGVAVFIPAEGQTCELLIQKADQALYAAKEQGRNRVVVFDAS